MKFSALKTGMIAGALVAFAAMMVFDAAVPRPARAQFNDLASGGNGGIGGTGVAIGGGPVAIGQAMAQRGEGSGAVTIFQAPPIPQEGGGLIQLKVFGWLEPYADALAQALIAAGFAWFMKSKYSQMLDEGSRAALEAFLKNRASSLIADGFVKMNGKEIDVHSDALAREVSTASDAIPGAMKRFGLTPGLIAQKIVDAIPQTAAGAQIVASAHAEDVSSKSDLAPVGPSS